ncbi:MAG: Pr6Pr family membrane protein [Clostridia bacterium]|nr:Pr6Pr family membrane protein [Clostridia bacterium]
MKIQAARGEHSSLRITKAELSLALNFLIFSFATVGITLAFLLSDAEGYSHPYKRLLYFTQQSNIWIGLISGAFFVLLLIERRRGIRLIGRGLRVAKYVFTVSITVTCLIFCSLLAPFADYNVWSFQSIITHVIVPALSVVELFFCQSRDELRPSHCFLALVPPSFYFVLTTILCIFKVDFGKGDAFPYFFMDFYSEVGMFGADFSGLPKLGTFYWIIFLLSLMLGLAFGYRYVYNRIGRRREEAEE